MTVRLDAELLRWLDAEASRIEEQNGVRIGRAGCVLAVLRRASRDATGRALADAVPPSVPSPRAKAPGKPSKPSGKARRPKGKPGKAPSRPTKGKRASLEEPNLRERCRAVPGGSMALAAVLEITDGAVRNWWNGKRSWAGMPKRLDAVSRWLTEHETARG